MPQATAIVTGHSRGLGAAVARELLQRGIPVLGVSRRPHPDLAAQFPGLLDEMLVDLSDVTAVQKWLGGPDLRARLQGVPLTMLVNNAGVIEPIGPLASQDMMAISRAIAINVSAPLVLASAVAAATLPTQDRRILHVSSGAARHAYAGWSVYCATKAALDHHARGVALDGTPGLRVCSLAPGVIDTTMQAEIRAASLDVFPQRPRFDALKEQGALAQPDACARDLVAYMLSDRFGEDPVADLRDIDGG